MKSNTFHSIYKIAPLLLIVLFGFFSSVQAQCDMDSDNDGVCDGVDLDDDNDGILDEIECPNTYVSKAFQTSNGTTTTFLAPSADGGFQFDIFKLDNSFNLKVNGIDVVPNQIQCSGSGLAGESLLVFDSDNTGFGQGGNDHVWVINGDDEKPVVRLKIDSKGGITFEGKRSSGRELEPMKILSGDPQPSNIVWNTTGENEVVLSQKVVGPTNITGEGHGIVMCTIDTDGDGLKNSLDTDSDGDGCQDALEGGAGFQSTDLSGEVLSGAVSTNGVPVLAGNGQTVGTSVNNLQKASVCDCDDNDGDGVCDDDDLDDDNDGILDVDECMTSNFQWSGVPSVNGKTATGVINGVGYSYTSSINIETTPTIFAYNKFPSHYNIPNTTVIKNRFTSNNVITFDQPVLNPTLMFSSIGGGPTVPIEFSNAVEVLFQSGPVTINSPTKITGKEGYVVLRMNGVFNQISFDYLADENYVNFTFGADFATHCDTDGDGIEDYLDLDSDDDGCADAIEGDAGFKLSDINNDVLVGNVDVDGVPVLAAGGQAIGSSADENTQSDVCDLGPITEDTLYVCEGESIQIEAKDITDEIWGGDEDFILLNKSTIQVSPDQDAYYFVGSEAGYTVGQNIIINGDFEQGGVGFTSGYTDGCALNVLNEGRYCVNPNPKATHNGFRTCGDHTSGTGNMMVVNAATTAGVSVWCQTVTVEPATDYEFSGWITSVHPSNPAILEFKINGALMGSRLTATSTACKWDQYAAQWNSGLNTSVEICLDNQNTASGGNDFAIDDISFAPVTQTLSSSDSVLVIVEANPAVNLGKDTILCTGESTSLNAPNASNYTWSTGDDSQSINVGQSGEYWVDIETEKGCVSTDTIKVFVESCVESLCGDDINFNSWSQAGAKAEGNWNVSADGRSVNQTINGAPTFYIGNKEFLNVNFTGKMRTDFTHDNDWMGMVFGFQGGELSETYPMELKTYVFGWKQGYQSFSGKAYKEGFSLLEVNTTINSKNDLSAAFGSPYKGATVLDSLYGSGTGYEFGKDYEIKIDYTASNIKIYVDHQLIFDVDGCFDPGKIGFYNWSQPDVTYSDFTYQYIGNVEVLDDTLCLGEELTAAVVNGPVCSSEDYYPEGTLYEWDLQDGTSSSENKVNHIYDKSGVYDLELVISDGIGCSDTTIKTIVVKDHPTVDLGNDTTICVNESVEISVMQSDLIYHWNTGAQTQLITISEKGEYGVEITDEFGCFGSDSIELFFQDLPVVDLGKDIAFCDGQSVILDAKNEGLNYKWNTDEEDRLISVTQSGTYGVVVTDEFGCLGSDSLSVTVNPMPVVDLGNDTAICIGESVVLNALNSGFSYIWSTGETSQEISINSTGDYEVRVYDAIGCADTAEMNLRVNELPVVNLGNDTVICEYQSVVLDAQHKGHSYLWNTGGNSQIIEVSEEGSYAVEVRDSIGCLGTDEIYVTKEFIEDPFLEKEKIVCEGASIFLEPDITNSYEIYWENNPKSASLEVFETGNYLSFVESEFCLDTFEINVTKIDTPHAEIIDLGGKTAYCFELEKTNLKVSSEDNNTQLIWDDFGRSDEVEIEVPGTYLLLASNAFCSALYHKEVVEYCEGKLFIPNAFTPADDNGLNQVFMPVTNGHVDNFDFRIYNRWGVLIYQTNILGEGWDGTVSGRMAECDVYVYKVTYDYVSDQGGIEQKQQNGTVALMK